MNSESRVLGAKVSSPLLRGLIWSIIWLGAGALFLSMMLAGSTLREDELLPWVFGVHGAASFAGGFAAARRSRRKGWYFGFLNGVLYTAAIVLTSFLATDMEWSIRVPAMLGVACLAGAIGGMLGVNAGR